MRSAQEARMLYFKIKICTLILVCFKQVKLILAKALERRIIAGAHDFEVVDPEDFVALRRLAMKRRKPCFGRIIQEHLKGAIDRWYRKMVKTTFVYINVDEEPMLVNGDNDKSLSGASSRTSSFSTIKSQYNNGSATIYRLK